LSAVGVLAEALLLRSLLDLGYALGIPPQRLGTMGVLLLFLVAMLLVNVPIASGVLRIGRKLELSLRVKFLAKIPRISDRYFHSGLLADRPGRSHALPALRRAPALAYDLWSSLAQLVFTTAGLVWLEPRMGPAAAVVGASALAMALLSQAVLN